MLSLEEQKHQTHALFALWRDWVIACGAPMVVMLFSIWIPAIWLPLVTFALTALLIWAVKVSKQSEYRSCHLTIYVVYNAMFWSGLIMMALSFLVKHELLEQWFGAYNRVHAYIPELVIAPVTYLFAQYAWIRRSKLRFCVDCNERMGQGIEQGFLGRMFRQEGRYQQKVLTLMFLGFSIEGYLYYWLVYYNGYYSPTDKFAFVWLPIIVYGGSVVLMGVRYYILGLYYSQSFQGGDVEHASVTRLRFLVVHDDKIYLAPSEENRYKDGIVQKYDTPAIYTFQRRDNITVPEAEEYFVRLTKVKELSIRFMYESETVGGAINAIHFIAEIKNPAELEDSPLKGEWYTLSEVNDMLHQHRLAPMFLAELHRLYHVTMAWKTYDRNGHRRYRQKHYRPAFRMADIHNPKIDYNDMQWLYVSRMNEDIPFFRLRRWWDRVINGVDYTSEKNAPND